MKRQLFTVAIVALLALASWGCPSEIQSVTVPDVPTPGEIAGAWSGFGSWSARQDGDSLGPVSSGPATAIVFQNGAAILTSSWEITGIYVGTLTGSVDPAGLATGTATVTPVGAGCTATAPWGGNLDGDQLVVTMSFADPGSVPCGAAPVGLTMNLAR